MTNLQKITLRLSAVRSRLNEIAGLEGDAFTDEIRSESETLGNDFKDLETRHRAAIIGDDAEQRATALEFSEGPEGAEMRSLVGRCNVGRIVDCVVENRAVDGADAELQQHYKMGSHQIPLALLRGGGSPEVRTSGFTPAPSNVQGNQQPIIPAVFPQSCAEFIGVDMPTVPVGDAIFPVLSTSVAPGTPAANADQGTSEAAFSAEKLSPGRIQAAFFYSREDRASFAQMDEALRKNLSDALADKLDSEILAGAAGGLFNGAILANHNVTAETTFALYRSQLLYGRVDGKYANEARQIRVVLGSGTYAHAASQYRSNNADFNALDSLMRDSGGVKVSAHVPAVASTRQNALIRLGSRRDYVAPIWDGIEMVVDPYTQAKAGEIIITGVMLYAKKLLRADGFYKQQTQHA